MPPQSAPRNPARRIVLIYLLVSAAWILLSDRAVAFLSPDVAWATRLSIAKGWAFVAFTSLLLYHFIRRSFAAERRIREGLAASEACFSKAFHANPSPVAILQESDGRFLRVNESFCRLLDLPATALLGRTTQEAGVFADPPDRDRLRAELERTGALRSQELALRTTSGGTVQVLLSVERIQLEGLPCLLATFHDLTLQRQNEAERRRLEAEVQHVHKLESLGTLAGGVAHDMNNILGAVMGVASLVQERHREDAGLARDMDTLLRAAARGRDLVRGLTDFARKGLQEPRPTDLNDLLAHEAELLRRTTLNRIEVVLDLAEALPPVMGDPSSLSNAVMNLCVNAVDAMPSGGRLRLATRLLPEGQVQVAIQDTGTGMSPDVLTRALDPFYTTKPRGKGTGLGLSLAHSIAQAHRGRLELDSTEGQGTEVRLVFPALKEAPPPASGPSEAGSVPRPASLRILVVDDYDLLRDTVPAMLEALGHHPAVVASGPEALQRLASGPAPELMILDVNMPGMDGLEVLAGLRARHPGLAVLFASGLKDPRLLPLLAEDPAVGFLAKPFTLPELRDRIQGLCGGP